jgi:hypothetical protein
VWSAGGALSVALCVITPCYYHVLKITCSALCVVNCSVAVWSAGGGGALRVITVLSLAKNNTQCTMCGELQC